MRKHICGLLVPVSVAALAGWTPMSVSMSRIGSNLLRWIPAIRIRRATALLLVPVAVAVVWPSGVAHAYNDYDNPCGKWANPPSDFLRIGWKWGGSINPNGSWANAYQLASSNWTGTATKVVMGYLSSAQATGDVAYDSTMPRGWAYVHCYIFTSQISDFNTYGNTYQNPEVGGDATMKQRTTTHEFGHGLGLGHSYDSQAVMDANDAIYGPGADDVNGLNAMYPW